MSVYCNGDCERCGCGDCPAIIAEQEHEEVIYDLD